MSEYREESGSVESTTVGVYRTAATIKGGRRFSFGALVVCGDRHGQVGFGYGKANEVPPAIEKAEKEARRSLKKIYLKEGTIPHTVTGRFGASKVRLVPASPGTGVVAGGTVRSVLELAGVRDCLTKSFGSTNQKNLVKATMAGLEQLRSKEEIERLRGVELGKTHVEEIVERGAAFMPPPRKTAEAEPKKNGEAKGGKKGRGKGRGKKSGGDEAAEARVSGEKPKKAESEAPKPKAAETAANTGAGEAEAKTEDTQN